MMHISPKVLETGAILAREVQTSPFRFIIVPAPETVRYPQDEQNLRKLVAKEIRSLLEREDIRLILAVFGFFGITRPYIIGGSEIETKDGTRAEYGFDSQGPFKATFRSRQFRPKHGPLSVDRVSPEELLEHIEHPAVFLNSITHHLDAAAQAILKR
jgi:hypothetical protein